MTPRSPYKISASSFYNLSQCERRVWMDHYANPDEMGEYSDFLQLLWEHGLNIERDIIEKIRKDTPIVEIKGHASQETFEETIKLMKAGAPLIYQGVLVSGDKVGKPDLLEKVSGKSKFGNYFYVPCDIKSGRATKTKDGDEIKKHYAAQMLFYCELLNEIQGVKPESSKIISADGEVTEFNIHEYEEHYLDEKILIEKIVYQGNEPEPIIGGICSLCVWKKSCRTWAEERQDPTLLFYLGKPKEELKKRGIHTIKDVSQMDIAPFLTKEGKIKGVTETRLLAWKRRAAVWLSQKPIVHTKPDFKSSGKEVYYDIETDPSQDHVYLHGIIEVVNGRPSSYKYFWADSHEEEKKTAIQMWEYIEALSDGDVIFHYGSYERTGLMNLMGKYHLPPKVFDKFEALRKDLYRVVESCSYWPVSSYGIKNVARCLGFNWTAEDAGGANSIAWFNDYQKNPGRKELLEKILTYNREDCEAMVVVKDWLSKNLPKKS